MLFDVNVSQMSEHDSGPRTQHLKNRFNRRALRLFSSGRRVSRDGRCRTPNRSTSARSVVTFRGSGVSRSRARSLSTASSSSSAMFTAGTLSARKLLHPERAETRGGRNQKQRFRFVCLATLKNKLKTIIITQRQ